MDPIFYHPLQTPHGPRFYGKYRGKVTGNLDPLKLGRVLVEVPAIPGMLLNWANPSVPYARLQVGFFALPPVGADVWVEFEAGDPSYPIWSGCFWEALEVPLSLTMSPAALTLTKVLRSDFCTLTFSDVPGEGGITLSVTDPAVQVPATLIFNSAGVSITCGPSSIRINPEEGITINVAESVVTLTEEAIAANATDMNVTAEVTVEGPVEVTGGVTIDGEVTIDGGTEINGPVVANGDFNLTGEAAISGAATIDGGLLVTGDSTLFGAVTLLDEASVGGLLTVAGDTSIEGAALVNGVLAVDGLIFGVVVPPEI